MEPDIFVSALSALQGLLQLERLLYLSAGVLVGIIFAIIPGLGGVLALSLALPFTYFMDPWNAIALMLGIMSITATADSIPAILMGIPGTVGAAATVMDGYPMAQQGKAKQALGYAFSSSVLGGLFGALVLGLMIPFAPAIFIHFATPEVFTICLFGLGLVVILTAGRPFKGCLAVCLGILVASVGESAITGIDRLSYNWDTIYDGFNLVVVILGIYAIPEMVSMFNHTQSYSLSEVNKVSNLSIFNETLKHKRILIQSSVIGCFLGAIPGVGGAVIDWISYALAKSTLKNNNFGNGDPRGVIASESSNNAKDGGSLIPLLVFGIPGTSMAGVFLVGLYIHGIEPNKDMLTTQLDTTYLMVWSIALGNILGVLVCFALMDKLTHILKLKNYLIISTVLALCYLGVLSITNDIGNFVVLFAFSILGYIMKQYSYSRPAFILAFLLGEIIEKSVFKSYMAFGLDFLTRPIVLTLLVALGLFIVYRVAQTKLQLKFTKPTLSYDLLILVLFSILFVFVLYTCWNWDLASSIGPKMFGLLGLLSCSFILFTSELHNKEQLIFDIGTGERQIKLGFWIASASIPISAYVLNLYIGVFVCSILVFIMHRTSIRKALFASTCITSVCYIVYDVILNVKYPATFLSNWLTLL